MSIQLFQFVHLYTHMQQITKQWQSLSLHSVTLNSNNTVATAQKSQIIVHHFAMSQK